MTAVPPPPARPPAADARALRGELEVLLSSVELLHNHIDRLPRQTRDRQLAVLKASALAVQARVEILLEGPG